MIIYIERKTPNIFYDKVKINAPEDLLNTYIKKDEAVRITWLETLEKYIIKRLIRQSTELPKNPKLSIRYNCFWLEEDA